MIYFDNAATVCPKPQKVIEAALSAAALGNPGRGGHEMAMRAARALYTARETLKRHFGAPEKGSVSFFYNATTALNAVMKSLARPGTGLVISDMEHNAVRRPALALQKRGVLLKLFRAYQDKEKVVRGFEAALDRKTRLAVFVHTSNICSFSLPVKELCAVCRKKGVLSLVDCAQAGGHLPLNMGQLGANGMVFPSHKGLLGIAGAGVLIADEALTAALSIAPTLMEGGSGVRSKEEEMPGDLPERLEWGTPGLPAIVSVGEGVRFIEEIGYEEISRRERTLHEILYRGLESLAPVRLHGMQEGTVGPILFTAEGFEGAALAEALNEKGVCLREGFHCAPLAHETIGTGKTGGLRIGCSFFNTPLEAERFLEILKRVLRA